MMTNKSVYLKVPTLEELKFTEMLLQDEETMSFNKKWGGTVSFPREKWESFYNEYVHNPEREYYHIYNLDNQFVGEISYRSDEYFNSYMMNIKIMHKYRGNSHAIDALEVFLDYFFEDEKHKKISDNIAIDNIGAIKLMEKVGFKKIYETKEYAMMELLRKNY